jgi:hypothetical protein
VPRQGRAAWSATWPARGPWPARRAHAATTRTEHVVHAAHAIHGLPRNEAEAWALLDYLFAQSTRIGWPDHLKATLLGAGLERIYADGPGLDDPRWDGQL